MFIIDTTFQMCNVVQTMQIGFFNTNRNAVTVKHIMQNEDNEAHINLINFPAVPKPDQHKYFADGHLTNLTKKPIDFTEQLIEHFSKCGDWIMSLCSGSGIDLKVAIASGRHCISVDIDPHQVHAQYQCLLELCDEIRKVYNDPDEFNPHMYLYSYCKAIEKTDKKKGGVESKEKDESVEEDDGEKDKEESEKILPSGTTAENTAGIADTTSETQSISTLSRCGTLS